MNSIRRLLVVAGLLIACAAFTGSPAHAACTNLTINNPTGLTLFLIIWTGGATPVLYTVAPGANVFAPAVPVAAQSNGGTNVPLTNGCTPCIGIKDNTGTVTCMSWCYDPVTCTININVTPCTPPAPCIP
jgi:hypothetical protein